MIAPSFSVSDKYANTWVRGRFLAKGLRPVLALGSLVVGNSGSVCSGSLVASASLTCGVRFAETYHLLPSLPFNPLSCLVRFGRIAEVTIKGAQ
ncbi:hypothetical protein CXF95_18655 [Paraglaciecola sp. MB-3u-78]|nr:hypothetical protein CXF95_18655 [Paraglaciecola sp. MB-3u-78]